MVSASFIAQQWLSLFIDDQNFDFLSSAEIFHDLFCSAAANYEENGLFIKEKFSFECSLCETVRDASHHSHGVKLLAYNDFQFSLLNTFAVLFTLLFNLIMLKLSSSGVKGQLENINLIYYCRPSGTTTGGLKSEAPSPLKSLKKFNPNVQAFKRVLDLTTHILSIYMSNLIFRNCF